MVIFNTPVQFSQELGPLNQPRPLSVGDTIRAELALLLADRSPADGSGPGQGTIVRANAVGAMLVEQLVGYVDYEFTFGFWMPGNNDLATLTLTKYCDLIMVSGWMLIAPEQMLWCTPGGTIMKNYSAGLNYWILSRAKTLYFKSSDITQQTFCGSWGFY